MPDGVAVEPKFANLDEGLVRADAKAKNGQIFSAFILLARLQEEFSANPLPLIRAIDLMREAGRHLLAAAIADEGHLRFPTEARFPIAKAEAQQRLGMHEDSLQSWAIVRNLLPTAHIGWTAPARALREARRFPDAEQLLTEAAARLPDDPGPLADLAWLSQTKRDWVGAEERWRNFRERFTNIIAGWVQGALCLRELRRFDEADQLLREAQHRFPDDASAMIDYAWLSWARRDWTEAARRWRAVRERFPDRPVAWLREALSEAEQWRYAEAEALFAEAVERFPTDATIALEGAAVIMRQQRLEDALLAYTKVIKRFPDLLPAQLSRALIFRNQFRMPEAESCLLDIMRHFPSEPEPFLEFAKIPMFQPLRKDQDPATALLRLKTLCERFPTYEPGYLERIKLLCTTEQYDEAEAIARDAVQHLPNSANLAVEFGNIARLRGNTDDAVTRFQHACHSFPDHPGSFIGLGTTLLQAGKPAEADDTLREATKRFPAVPAGFIAYAECAMKQQNWQLAISRLAEGQRHFPDDKSFAHRIFDARMQLVEAGTQQAEPTSDGSSGDDPRAALRDFVMQFESLGGRGLGCEFGMFQREFGAEPLGLLRWADMTYDAIVHVLETRFDGVGDPNNTDVFVNRENSRPEYCSVDARGFMFMRAFVYEDEMPLERIRRQILQRLKYLKQKLMDDLQTGGKIFVWRCTERNLTDNEIRRLHAAVRSYGDNILLYARLADAQHPNGTVEVRAPGLMVGYMDQFKMAPDGKLRATPPTASWLKLCQTAFTLADRCRQTESADSVYAA